MSAIIFHTQNEGEARLRGSELAYMGVLVTDLNTAFLPSYVPVDVARRLVGDALYIDKAITDAAKFDIPPSQASINNIDLGRAMFSAFCGDTVLYQGKPISAFCVALNTIIRAGGDELRLLARLKGQCEIHAFVEGPNRAWLADLMTRGRDMNLYRADQGWEDVITLLEGGDTEPVVCSYTVTDGFPNSGVTDWEKPADGDAEGWYDLSHEDQWSLSMSALRRRAGGDELELAPHLLARLFGDELSLFDLLADVGWGMRTGT